MKKWYQWFYLSLGFAVGGILSFLDGKRIIASVLQVSITFVLAFVQFLCDEKGEAGKKTFKYISIFVTVLLVLWLLFLIFDIFV